MMLANQPYTPDTAKQTIVIVGMRASGKSTLGKAAAEHLGWKFIDADEVFESSNSVSCGKYIEENGWEKFREAETEILQKALEDNPTETVFSCGGGIVETEPAREILKSHRPVIHVQRHIDDIIETLQGESTEGTTEESIGTERRPNYGESISKVWERREPWFHAVCTHEYLVHKGDKKWKRQTSNFLRLVANLQQLPTPHILRPGSTFCVLDVDAQSACNGDQNIVKVLKSHKEALRNCEGLNLRWSIGIDPNMDADDEETRDALAAAVAEEDLSLLKVVTHVRNALSHPILLSFHQDALSSLQVRLALIQSAARVGCEYVRVEVADVDGFTRDLSHLGATRLLVEHHVKEPSPTSEEGDAKEEAPFGESYLNNVLAVERGFDRCAAFAAGDPGHQEVAGIWVRFTGENTAGMASLLCSEAQVLRQKLPHYIHAIGFSCNGSESLLSQALCLDHGPAMWEPKSPWPMPASAARLLLAMPSRKYFYLFGSPIQGSPSPTLHNTGFGLAGLQQNSYGICDTPSISTVKHLVNLDSFGGASVTIPHKSEVIPLMDSLSPSAQAINAVNTIIVKNDPSDAGKRQLHGDNTDWIGIRNLLQRHERLSGSAKALVVGAGGTSLAACYCVKQMGLELVVYNRTSEKAEKVATRFDGKAITSISKSNIAEVDVVISTVPATSEFVLPDYILEQKPIVLDVAYKPRRTKLLQAAASADCVTHEGIEMLIEQGLEQFRLWTGVEPTRSTIEEAVYAFYDETTKQ